LFQELLKTLDNYVLVNQAREAEMERLLPIREAFSIELLVAL